MPARHTLEASERTIIGKAVNKLRRQGETPGIVYGPVIESPLPVSVDTRTLEKLYVDFGSNMLIDLTVNSATYTVYMRNVDIDRLARRPRHVEFYAPNLRVAITSSVPLIFTGVPADERLIVNHGHGSLQLHGLPQAIPAVIEVDLSRLAEPGDSIHVSDIPVPDGVQVMHDPDELIASVDLPSRAAAEEEEAEIEEAVEPEVFEEAQPAEEA